ncbi:hypothetical protein BHE74_00056821 [Ensete ventricosum]|nr:hypothetical protein BHE74_00056821 [Ensete ventricosum]
MKGKGATAKNYFVLNTGAKIPAVGLATWQHGGDLCAEAVATALTAGYRHIDCTHLYGNEVEVGKALAEAFESGAKREDLFLTSKLYCATNSHKRVENSVRVSLKSLGVSYLDLYLVHWPDCSALGDATDPSWKSASEYRQFSQRLKPTWESMEGLVQMGLVRAIGVSNFNIQQISELLQFAKIVPAVNQVTTALLSPGLSDSGSEDEAGTPRITFRRSRSVHGPMMKVSVVVDIAERHSKTPEQVSTSIFPKFETFFTLSFF